MWLFCMIGRLVGFVVVGDELNIVGVFICGVFWWVIISIIFGVVFVFCVLSVVIWLCGIVV